MWMLGRRLERRWMHVDVDAAKAGAAVVRVNAATMGGLEMIDASAAVVDGRLDHQLQRVEEEATAEVYHLRPVSEPWIEERRVSWANEEKEEMESLGQRASCLGSWDATVASGQVRQEKADESGRQAEIWAAKIGDWMLECNRKEQQNWRASKEGVEAVGKLKRSAAKERAPESTPVVETASEVGDGIPATVWWHGRAVSHSAAVVCVAGLLLSESSVTAANRLWRGSAEDTEAMCKAKWQRWLQEGQRLVEQVGKEPVGKLAADSGLFRQCVTVDRRGWEQQQRAEVKCADVMIRKRKPDQ